MAVSLDAASEQTFDSLRVRGRRASWQTVLENLHKISELQKTRGFQFKVSMTLNSENCHEIEDFIDLAITYGAEPLIMLVANPYQTVEFHKKYLIFDEKQFRKMELGIKNGIAKVRSQGYDDAELYLRELLKHLKYHRDVDNDVISFSLKKVARNAFYTLPEQLQIPVRKWVQKKRVEKLEKLDS